MTSPWEQILKDRVQLYGHRNWLVIADSAFPAQSRQGIEVIVVNDEQTTVLARTFEILRECKHIKPTIYTDQELNFVPESDAPGVTSYRKQLALFFRDKEIRTLPHEEIISRLDQVAAIFRVLFIKTNMRIPYTSVFLELECGYWNAQAEDRLRAAMSAGNGDRSSSVAERVRG